jgi:hypothetical protein
MSYTWVMKYLPQRFKDSAQSERRTGLVTRRITRILDEFLRPPKREGALKIKNYANTDFVTLILKKDFYEEFERNSLELEVPTEISALKALEDYHEKMKRVIAIKSKSELSGESENHRT